MPYAPPGVFRRVYFAGCTGAPTSFFVSGTKRAYRWAVPLLALMLALPVLAAPKPAPASKVVPAAKTAAPARKRTEVKLAFTTKAPDMLVPMKPGTTMKVAPQVGLAVKAGPLSPVSALAFSPDGTRLYVGTYGRVSIWDPVAGKVLGHLDGVEGAVHQVRFSRDGKRIGVAGGKAAISGSVLIYDGTAPGKPLRRLAGHADVVYDFAWAPDGKRIATAGFDKQVRLWDVEAGKDVLTLKDHSDSVTAVAFSPDGRHLVSAGKDKSIKLFEAHTGKAVRAFTGHREEVLAVAFSPDGKAILSTGVEPQIRWWNAETGASLRTVGGHGGEVYEIRFGMDGKQFVTVSQDRSVRLWDVATGAIQKDYASGGDLLLSAALSPDGKRVAAGSWTGLVRLWDSASKRLLVLGFENPDSTPQPEYLLATPEGYISGSEGMVRQVEWQVGGEPVAGEPFVPVFARPEEVLKALKGEAVTAVKF